MRDECMSISIMAAITICFLAWLGYRKFYADPIEERAAYIEGYGEFTHEEAVRLAKLDFGKTVEEVLNERR